MMEDIFSFRKVKIIERAKVIADYREKNSLVIAELISLGIEVIFENLEIGDFIVNENVIERKTVSDFISSMINKRLISQLENLWKYENRLLIIEGIDEKNLYDDKSESVNANAIRGFLLSIVLKFKVPIIFTKNSEDTAKFLSVLARKKEREMGIREGRKTLSLDEQKQYILEGFSGVGPKTAKKLLEKYGTLRKIFNTPLDELKKEVGKKADSFNILD